MGKTAFVVSLLVALVSTSARSDDWVRPEPTSFHSRGFGYVAEIYVVLPWGTALEFLLEDGTFRYGGIKRYRHSNARRRSILRNGAFRNVDVDVETVHESVIFQSELLGVTANVTECGMGRLFHYVAQLPGQLKLAFAGHGVHFN